MKKSKFTDTQIAFVLRQAQEGTVIGVTLPPWMSPPAGKTLGTARRVAGSERRWSFVPWRRREIGLHQQALDALAAGAVDELSVLTDLEAFGSLEGRIISCAIRCNDRVVGIEGVNPAEAAVRVMGANLTLRAQTRRSTERSLEAGLVSWAQKVINRSFDLPDSPGQSHPDKSR